MFGVTIAFTVYNVVVNEHPHKREDLPYLKTRTKPFPWQECHDCALFDLGDLYSHLSYYFLFSNI